MECTGAGGVSVTDGRKGKKISRGKARETRKRQSIFHFLFKLELPSKLQSPSLLSLVAALSTVTGVMDASMHATRAVDILCYLHQQPEVNMVCFSPLSSTD